VPAVAIFMNPIKKSHRIFDDYLHRMKRRLFHEGTPLVITCHKGCFSCCKEPVYTTLAEAEYIAQHLADNASPEQLEMVKKRLRVWLDKVISSGILKRSKQHVLAWRALNAWCPLLKDGKCSVYQQRPIGCRAHNAIGKASLCDAEETRMRQKYVNSPEIIQEAFNAVYAEEDSVEFDHLGLLLAKILLGEEHASADNLKVNLAEVGQQQQE
jgi:Fe-S-cluster containining protein